MHVCAGGAPALDDLLGGVSSQPAAPTTSNLADLLGGDHTPQPSTSANASSFADLLSQPAASSSPQMEPFTAFEKDGIRVVFRASKPAGQEAVTDITASYSNASGQAISDFSLQVSVKGVHHLWQYLGTAGLCTRTLYRQTPSVVLSLNSFECTHRL